MNTPKPQEPLRSEFAADPEMLELVELYVADMPDRVALLRRHWDAHEAEDVRRIAHQLKGASAGYGFPTVGEAARELEEALKDETQELERLAAEFDALVDVCSRVTL